ncbi:MAG: 2Fe-2S iron-sulfur cluster-binding protein, partial [Acidobacteriota bacterium]|nr:2Fe-2S iron-sulfur cluster-binding protein [Acidobacteriota bacterium]
MDELREDVFLQDDLIEELREDHAETEADDGREESSGGLSDVTRRTFIQGSVATGAAVSMAGGNLLQPDVLRAATEPVARTIDLRVNGETHELDVEPMDTLAMVLRYKLDLTGTKLGCDRAECGACTVLIDDVPHYGCSMLVHQVRGREVTTVEGLERDGVLHPVQQAVLDEMGFQCAF